jgi:hypothetical protein
VNHATPSLATDFFNSLLGLLGVWLGERMTESREGLLTACAEVVFESITSDGEVKKYAWGDTHRLMRTGNNFAVKLGVTSWTGHLSNGVLTGTIGNSTRSMKMTVTAKELRGTVGQASVALTRQ